MLNLSSKFDNKFILFQLNSLSINTNFL